MDSRMERDFMGLNRRKSSEIEAERTSNNEQPHGEREKIVGLSLFQEDEKKQKFLIQMEKRSLHYSNRPYPLK